MDADVNEKEAFRLGFLTRCAEEGLTGEQLRDRIKTASEKKAHILSWIVPSILALAGYARPKATGIGLGLPVAAGLIGGGALGYGAAKMFAPNVTEDDVKADELAQTYKIYEQRARAKRKAYQYRQKQQ